MRRQTKEQRTAAEKDKLQSRVTDLLRGASRGVSLVDEPDVGVLGCCGIDEFAGWLIAMQRYLCVASRFTENWTEEKLRAEAFGLWHLGRFEHIATAVEHLYGRGFRA